MDTPVIILDFGSQYTQLIARRVRELGVRPTLLPCDAPIGQLRGAKAIILSGGPDSVYEKNAPTISKKVFTLGIPVLGVCYGLQIMAQVLGGTVERADKKEFGPATLHVKRREGLFGGIPESFSVWMSHGDFVTKLPPGFTRIAVTDHSPDAAIGDPHRHLYGVQFHPEVEHTSFGLDLFKNFLFGIAGCTPTWKVDDFVEQKISEIRKAVGTARVICTVSGGVDSSITAALVGRAIGDQLTCIFVDHGLLRKNEAREVMDLLHGKLGLPVRMVNAETQFLRALKGISFGEAKRKIIGREFIRAFERATRSLKPRPLFLAQGTIHSDVVESANTATGKKTHVIKSHHNVGGLPARLRLQLIEPLRDIFKDEVRRVGEALGLPHSAVWRQPFPGPGLAIRIAGEVTREKIRIVQDADAIVREEIESRGMADQFYHYFAMLLSQKTVGVVGDMRNYAYPIVLKVVVSSDIMTSDWARLPHDLLAHLSRRITNEVPGVARVLYDITTKPPGTTEWE